mmetsp:Transcript_30467/g.90506  ORF Transcript_30467/g.90506 Transcript_30467/m.90506 type:complete len:203 (-) Transcript_30467:692-1300(-)
MLGSFPTPIWPFPMWRFRPSPTMTACRTEICRSSPVMCSRCVPAHSAPKDGGSQRSASTEATCPDTCWIRCGVLGGGWRSPRFGLAIAPTAAGDQATRRPWRMQRAAPSSPRQKPFCALRVGRMRQSQPRQSKRRSPPLSSSYAPWSLVSTSSSMATSCGLRKRRFRRSRRLAPGQVWPPWSCMARSPRLQSSLTGRPTPGR